MNDQTLPTPVARFTRKRSTKRIAVAVAATSSILAVAACGSGSDGGSDGEVVLQYWTAATDRPVQEATEQIIEQFESDNPGIRVETQYIPFNEYFEKVSISFGGGNPPDVLWVDSTMTTSYGDQGLISSLEPYLTEEDKEDFYPAPREDMTYEGEVQSLPLHQSTEALVYIESVIEEAGVTPPTSYEDSWTWDEMVEAMHQVQDSGVQWGLSPTYGIGQYSVYPLVYSQGGSVYNQETNEFAGYLDSPETIDAVRKWGELYTEEGLSPVDILPDMLGTEQLAFQQANPFTVVDIMNNYPDLEVNAAPLPCDERCAVASGGWHVGISRASEHQEEAWELVNALAGTEGAATWSELTHYLPARMSAYEANQEWIEEAPWSIFWEGLLDHAQPRPRTAQFQLYADEFDSVLRDASTGTDPEAGLKNAVERLQRAQE